jgi:hypothetical protein
MKLDIFNHIFPKKFYQRMLEVAPNGTDIHKRVREIPSIVDLDERFRIMDRFDDYAQGSASRRRRSRRSGRLPSTRLSRSSPTTGWRSLSASIRTAFPRSSPRCR